MTTNSESTPKSLKAVFSDFFYALLANTEFIIKVIWLFALYVIATWLVIGTLTSQQFQQKIYKLTDPKTSSNYSVAQLISMIEQYEAGLVKMKSLKDEVSKQEKQVTIEDANIDKLRKERVKVIRELNQISATLSEEFVAVYQNWKEHKEKLTPIKKTDATNGTETEEIHILDIAPIAQGIKKMEDLSEKHKTYLDTMSKQVNKLNENEIVQKESEVKLIQSIKSLVDAIQDHQQAQDLLKDIDNNELRDLLVELRYLTYLKFKLLAIMPSQLLTLILTLSMGAFGSIIYLTRELLTDKQRIKSLHWYIFRPFLGMVTAIAIFVLVKSGQIIISDTSGNSAEPGGLNPFFVAFLAIISGMLSEHAYEKIYKTGQHFFNSSQDVKPKWGVRLKYHITKTGKSISDLCNYVEAPVEQIEKWVSEKEPVDAKEQKIIAAWLGVSSRDIFTEEPPRDNE
jgi:hypothetical protein